MNPAVALSVEPRLKNKRGGHVFRDKSWRNCTVEIRTATNAILKSGAKLEAQQETSSQGARVRPIKNTFNV